jgi:hypothetical protein
MLFNEATPARPNVITGLQRVPAGADIVSFETNRAVWYELWSLVGRRIATRSEAQGETSVVSRSLRFINLNTDSFEISIEYV